jgi:hypothetical protein
MAVTPSAPPRVPPAAPAASYPAPPSPDPAPAPFFNGLQGYERYARWALENLRSGGLLIGDNAYLFGNLVGEDAQRPEDRESIAAMRGFHELIAREMDGVCLPTPDGLAIGIER